MNNRQRKHNSSNYRYNIDESSSSRHLIPSNIIDESPEYSTTVEYDDPLIKSFQRFQKKITRGSMFNSTITLISFSPTSIILLSRFAFLQTGIFYGVIMYSTLLIASLFSMYLLIKILSKTHADNYHVLLKEHVKSKYVSFIFYSTLFVYFIVLNCIYFYSNIRLIINTLSAFNYGNEKDITIICILVILFFVIQLPSILIKQFNVAQTVSISLLFLIIISTIMVVGEMLLFQEFNSTISFMPQFHINFSYAICIFAMLSLNHIYLPIEVKEMNLYTYKRGKTLIEKVVIYEWILYTIYSIASYLLDNSYNKIDDNDLEIVVIITNHKEWSNFPMVLIQILIILLNSYKIGYNTNYMYDNLLYDISDDNIIKKSQNILNIITVIICGIAAFHMKEKYILIAIGICGGFCAYLICYLIPIYIYKRVFDMVESDGEFSEIKAQINEMSSVKHRKQLDWINPIVLILMFCVLFFGGVGCVYSVFNMTL
jgi:hypothetical protein